MTSALKQEWSKPSTILFATEIPPNQKAFAHALAQAREFEATLILFHVYDSLATPMEPSGMRSHDYASGQRPESHYLDPLADRAREAGVRCEVVVRAGQPAEQILSYLREREVDRVVMGTHSPGPVGKLLVGSVAEAVVRTATVPVFVVGPHVPEEEIQPIRMKTVLCACSLLDTTPVVAGFAASVAEQNGARLVLQHVIRPQDRSQVLAGRSIDQIENDLINLLPQEMHGRMDIQAVVVPGDPTEELLYQSRSQQADLIVLGAQGASAFAAITRHGIVYKLLAQAHCPVLTLSPAVLAQAGATGEKSSRVETFIAGAF